MGILTVLAGVAYANAAEWAIHKYMLHGLGKTKGSFWSYHWHDHHRACRKNKANYDVGYKESWLTGVRAKEFFGIWGLVAAHIPLLWVSPTLVGTLAVYGTVYLWAHKRSHLHPEWGFKYMPWHVDHHLGNDQDQNYCVLFPFFDWVMGTRKKFPEAKG